jgi:hypothetical protein
MSTIDMISNVFKTIINYGGRISVWKDLKYKHTLKDYN